MTSNQLEHEVGGNRDPIVKMGMVPMMSAADDTWRLFQKLANRLRAREDDGTLSDSECLHMMLCELNEAWEALSSDTQEDKDKGAASVPSSRHIPARVRRQVWIRARGRCEMEGCENSLSLQHHHYVFFSEGGSHSEENIGLACDRCHSLEHVKERRRRSDRGEDGARKKAAS
jgi:5-methylcytosine-specific restriction endonuclease McrA